MLKDDEVNLVALSEELAETLVTHFNEDLEHCEEVKEGTWKRRNVFRRALESLTRPFKQQI